MDESDEDSDEAASGTDIADRDFEEKTKVCVVGVCCWWVLVVCMVEMYG